VPRNAKALAADVQKVWDRADAEGRDLTQQEMREMEATLDSLEGMADIEKRVKSMSLSLGSMTDGVSAGNKGMSVTGDPGSIFVKSEGYKAIKDSAGRSSEWTSGLIDVGYPMQMKGTILEGAGSPGSGTGGGLVPVPQMVPGYVPKLFQPLTLEGLLLSGQATTSVVRYAVEGTATSGAAGVAEAGVKPESLLAFSTIDEPIKKVATSISISDEMLEDAPQVQSLINASLGQFVQIECERQLLRGTASGNEVQGILTSRNVPVYAGGTAAGNKAVQIFKAMNGVRGSAFVEPDWIVLHPTDYQDIRLLTDTAGQLFGGGPFQGPYGGGQNISSSGQITGAVDTVWNKPVYVTAAIGGAGTALIGTREGAQSGHVGASRSRPPMHMPATSPPTWWPSGLSVAWGSAFIAAALTAR
jgi:HK97 family phage major capsid protein